MNILDILHKNKQINQWQSGLNKSTRQLLLGLSGTSKSLVMATAYDCLAEKIMIVTASQNEAEKLVADLTAIIGSENVFTTSLQTIVRLQSLYLPQKNEFSQELIV